MFEDFCLFYWTEREAIGTIKKQALINDWELGWKTTGGGQKSLMLKNRSRERHMLRTLMVKENVVSFTLYFNAKFLVLIFAYVGDFIFFARLFVGLGPMRACIMR